MEIRPAGPGDDAGLARLFAAYHDEFRHDLGDQDVTAEGPDARACYQDGALLVAEHEGELIGCVAYQPWGPGRARMRRMFVLPGHRGSGAGRRLAQAIVEQARRDGHASMVLDTTPAMAAATRLYEQLGFTPFEPDYVAPCRDTVYLRATL